MKEIIKWIANNPKTIGIIASIINTIILFIVMINTADQDMSNINALLGIWIFGSSLVLMAQVFFLAICGAGAIIMLAEEGWRKFQNWANCL